MKNLIKNQTFLVQEPEKGEPLTPCMDVYKENIKYDGILDKLKLGIVIRGDLHNKQLVGYTWPPTASRRTFKYLLAYDVKHKKRVHQLFFIGSLLQAKVKSSVFVKLEIIYSDYFTEYSSYFGRSLR